MIKTTYVTDEAGRECVEAEIDDKDWKSDLEQMINLYEPGQRLVVHTWEQFGALLFHPSYNKVRNGVVLRMKSDLKGGG